MSRKRGSGNPGKKPKPKGTTKSKVTLESKSTSLDFRYGVNWVSISAKSRVICPCCCWCLVKSATLTHHVAYIDPITGELLLDAVVLGEDIFPVCKNCHSILHSGKYYIADEAKEKSRNTKDAIKRLKIGYDIIVRQPPQSIKVS